MLLTDLQPRRAWSLTNDGRQEAAKFSLVLLGLCFCLVGKNEKAGNSKRTLFARVGKQIEIILFLDAQADKTDKAKDEVAQVV
jgi:hypothetical protein